VTTDTLNPSLHRAPLAAVVALATVGVVASGVVFVSGEFLYPTRTEFDFLRVQETSDPSILHLASPAQAELELYHRAPEPG
jgi:hypothetical protein